MPEELTKPSHRQKLPETRRSIVHHFKVGEHKGYLIVGFYDDGRPGELFINMTREGSTLGGTLDAVAALTSIAMQNGVELEQLVHKFAFSRFEPSGHSSNSQIGFAYSIIDYVFRWLGHTLIPNYNPEHDKKTISIEG